MGLLTGTLGRGRVVERGATAVLVMLLLVPLIGFAALAIDISVQHETRQQLWDTLDAAALAGASQLPDATAAANEAQRFADANMPGVVPALAFWCVVGRNSSGLPDAADIPGTCDPGPGPYDAVTHPGTACNGALCAIPCDPFVGSSCNTLAVEAEEPVDYLFAPVIGFDDGSTGVLRTAACKGRCGLEETARADIAMVLDRTGSMGPGDVAALVDAAKAFLENLTPSLHHVALGTIGRSHPSPAFTCESRPSPSASSGPWVPVPLTDDYDLTDNDPPDSPPDLNAASSLFVGIDCLRNSSTGTNLGDPMAAAGSHVLSSGRSGVAKGVLFMTDGEANRPVGAPCQHAKTQAAAVEAQDVTIITVAYRLEGVTCDAELATDVLAQMASDPIDGPLTADDGGDGPGGLAGGCSSAAAVASENADGDHFLCAADEADLVSAFVAATGSLTSDFDDKVRLIRIPS